MLSPLIGAVSSWSGMGSFVGGVILLFVGYMTYGRFVEKVLAPDDRKTPALKYGDGVDYIVLPHWKNMLIQLLNIAGIGPVIGVIAGIKFGSIVFILIPIGNIIGGATHDFIAGMASLRNRGSNLPSFGRAAFGNTFYSLFSLFTISLLLLVVAVFINVPAGLVDKSIVSGIPSFWWAVALIFAYYIIATMFPVDRIIGKLYPIFGGVLLLGTLALFVSLLIKGFKDPTILLESENFRGLKESFIGDHPIIPCLFVTIACGILSGFHATQSPIIARTMKSEREARSSFYGMMVLEGLIAMVWAAASLAVYNYFLVEQGNEYWTKSPIAVLPDITTYFLGSGLGLVTVIAVIILAVTSGDTAMRCMRLTLAEMFKMDQKPILNRFLITAPLILLVTLLLVWSNKDSASFGKLWNYFAWGNQVLAVSTLGAGTVWLAAKKKTVWISAVPCFYMTFIVFSFLLWTSEKHNGPQGVGLDLNLSYGISFVIAGAYVIYCIVHGRSLAKIDGGKRLENEESDQEDLNAQERK